MSFTANCGLLFRPVFQCSNCCSVEGSQLWVERMGDVHLDCGLVRMVASLGPWHAERCWLTGSLSRHGTVNIGLPWA